MQESSVSARSEPGPVPTLGAGAGPTIVVVGAAFVDQITYLDRLPGPGETVVGRQYAQGFGGKGANQAVMASRLGARVSMAACVGDDDLGRATLDNFRAHGIATLGVRARSGTTTGVAPIWVEPSGENRIVIVPGASAQVGDEEVANAFATGRPSVVVGQLEVPQDATRSAFEAGRAVGALNILNPAPFVPVLPGLLALADWLVPNENEFAAMAAHVFGRPPGACAPTPELAVDLARRLDVGLVVTTGAAGAIVAGPPGDPVGVASVPSPAVEAIDTTGAGDAFLGAFAYRLALGEPAVDAARFACTVASLSVTRPGTQRSFPSAEEVAAFALSREP